MSSGSPSNANSPADTQATSVSPPGETDYSPTEPIKVEDTCKSFLLSASFYKFYLCFIYIYIYICRYVSFIREL